MRKYLALLLVTQAALNAQPGKVLAQWKNDPALAHASFGYCVADARSGTVIAEYNARLSLTPASTLKLFSTAAVVKKLGAGSRYETRLYHTGSIDTVSGILNGDLIISGSGDPSLQSEYFGKQSALSDWARTIQQKGIRQINGNIIGDGSALQREVNGSWLYEDVSNYFGTSACGLNFSDNKFTIIYQSGAEGTKAEITDFTPRYLGRNYEIGSAVVASGNEDQAYVMGDPFSFARTVTGSIPPNKKNYEVDGALPDPALLCAESLATELQKKGIVIDPKNCWSLYQRIRPRNDLYLLHSHFSPPIEELVYHTNMRSNNLYAESLVQTLGSGNRDEGLREVKRFCLASGLDTAEIFIKDACGLSRLNTCTPAIQTRLLCAIARDTALYRVINHSLPVAGKQGSMAAIGKGTALENNLRAKTGYIQRARAYAGYLTTKKGRDIAFSVMLSNYNCSPREARLKLETFMLSLMEL